MNQDCLLYIPVAAVHDGYVLMKSVIWAPLGGEILTECMRRCVDPEATIIKPRYEFRRVERSQGIFEACEKRTS